MVCRLTSWNISLQRPVCADLKGQEVDKKASDKLPSRQDIGPVNDTLTTTTSSASVIQSARALQKLLQISFLPPRGSAPSTARPETPPDLSPLRRDQRRAQSTPSGRSVASRVRVNTGPGGSGHVPGVTVTAAGGAAGNNPGRGRRSVASCRLAGSLDGRRTTPATRRPFRSR